jgi:hypothetical protein
VDKVEVLLWGSGNRSGCDLATQRKIREISGVVTELIRQLGSKLRVIRQQGRRVSGSTHTRTTFWEGNATMHKAMQVQIQQWTRSAHE